MDDVKATYSRIGCQMPLGSLSITLQEVESRLFAMCRYKIAKEKREVLVRPTAQARLPTEYGEFQVHSYEASDGLEHAALVAVMHISWPLFFGPAANVFLVDTTTT